MFAACEFPSSWHSEYLLDTVQSIHWILEGQPSCPLSAFLNSVLNWSLPWLGTVGLQADGLHSAGPSPSRPSPPQPPTASGFRDKIHQRRMGTIEVFRLLNGSTPNALMGPESFRRGLKVCPPPNGGQVGHGVFLCRGGGGEGACWVG